MEVCLERPLFLLTNDDGVDAPGLLAMKAMAETLGRVLVVAPHKERSGAGCAITLRRGLRFDQLAENVYAVDGTPADCVQMAMRMPFVTETPDWVLSGINRGPNLGDDTLFSGTVGAAGVGCLFGLRSMAVSMGDFHEPQNYDSAAAVVARLLSIPRLRQIAGERVININVPNLPFDQLQGLSVTTLCRRQYPRHFEPDPDDPRLNWYSKGFVGHDELEHSDGTAIDRHQVSVSILRPSLFDDEANARLAGLLPRHLPDLLT